MYTRWDVYQIRWLLLKSKIFVAIGTTAHHVFLWAMKQQTQIHEVAYRLTKKSESTY